MNPNHQGCVVAYDDCSFETQCTVSGIVFSEYAPLSISVETVSHTNVVLYHLDFSENTSRSLIVRWRRTIPSIRRFPGPVLLGVRDLVDFFPGHDLIDSPLFLVRGPTLRPRSRQTNFFPKTRFLC